MLRFKIPAQGPVTAQEEKDKTPLGRPPAERANLLTENVIDVASVLMLRHGYDGTSIDRIAASAGVTKRTIYAKFGSKENLLQKVLLQASLPATQSFESRCDSEDVYDRLNELGNHVLATLLEPEMVSWLRFISVEVARKPDLIRYIHPLIEQHDQLIQNVLEELVLQGVLQSNDVRADAYMFSALVAEPAQRYAFFAFPPGTKEQQHQYVCSAVRIFVAGTRGQ